jgi:catechol 2,3-dioxygenase-like lactoylglutathione lyase family enzyme
MLDHVGLHVRDPSRSASFYRGALAPLGAAICYEDENLTGFGLDGVACLWLHRSNSAGLSHVAFAAPSREAVDAFFRGALANGGRDNGAPGVRTDYGPYYYAAFVLDPDGHNIEVVFNGTPQ